MRYSVSIEWLEHCALFDIRGSATEVENMLRALGLGTQSGVMMKVSESVVVRIGPRRCLLQSDQSKESYWEKRLQQFATGRMLDAATVSDMYRGVEIRGNETEPVLSQAISMDLNEISVGEAWATEIFDLAGYLFRVESNAYVIYFEGSYTDYVSERLALCVGEAQTA